MSAFNVLQEGFVPIDDETILPLEIALNMAFSWKRRAKGETD